MKLFILGPPGNFGPPSIDAECNAAVALLHMHLGDQYDLIPTHENADRLPFLVDGQAQVSGFNNIVRHLTNKRILNEASELSPQQQADSIAFSAFIQSKGQILLDISYYVGFENYRQVTRPAFSKILPWHANYVIPPKRRNAARARTAHLGISNIDVDNVHEDMSHTLPGSEGVGKESSGFEAETKKRASLLLPRKDTIRSLLQQPQHAEAFKLHALAEDFIKPLYKKLSSTNFLLGTEQPTTVDCLLYGYLVLMTDVAMPQPWLSWTLMRYKKPTTLGDSEYGMLGMFPTVFQQRIRLEPTSVDDVLALSELNSKEEIIAYREKRRMVLPWMPIAAPTFDKTFSGICGALWEQVPIVGTPRLRLLDAKQFPFLDRNSSTILVAVTASLAAVGYAAVRTGTFIWPRGSDVQIFGRKSLSDFGDIGSALAGVRLLGPQAGRGG